MNSRTMLLWFCDRINVGSTHLVRDNDNGLIPPATAGDSSIAVPSVRYHPEIDESTQSQDVLRLPTLAEVTI
ncbi:hypothetical protein QUA04_14695 [Microcoleus sp. S13_C5]